MRAIKQTYQQLCAYIQANVKRADVPVFQWIDLWNEQTEYANDEYTYRTPALFIDFNVLEANSIGEWQDISTVDITFYVVVDTLANTYHGSSKQNTALDFLEIMSLLHEQLQGYAQAPFSSLTRTRVARFPTASLRSVYSTTYRTMIGDISPAEVRKPRKIVVWDLEPSISR